MTKDILIQYCDLQEEIKDLRKRINKLNDQIDKIEREGNVKDTVKGGNGGIQHFVIEGFPHPERNRKILKLKIYKTYLENDEYELLELTNSVEEYIQSIDDSRTRRIIRFRFIDSMTWVQVAISMGGKTTEESVRKEFERFFNEQYICP